jgi:hypothetical protein
MDVRTVLPPDAIPSVDDPQFRREYEGEQTDEVVVLDIDGEDGHEPAPARAYPVRFLHYHEIVNDRFRGVPVAVTWCPLCGSAVVYDRRAGAEAGELTFGVSGKLADDDLVMYDRETGSEWKQSLGRAYEGPLTGTELRVLPAGMSTYEAFAAAYPDGVVLAPPGGASEAASDDDTPARIDYDDTPYEQYFAMDGFGLDAHRGAGTTREWDREDLAPKAVVLGLEHDGDALGVPLERVRRAGGLVHVTVGGQAVVVLASDAGADGNDEQSGADAAGPPGDFGIHAYEAPSFPLSPAADGSGLRGDGTTWDPATGRAADGRRLPRVPARRLFAFAWQDDHGPDAFYEG